MRRIEYLEKMVREKNSKRLDVFFENFKQIEGCPVTATMRIIGGKWKPIILYMIDHDINRFGELIKLIGGVSKKVLTEQLRELERDDIINRKAFPGKTLKVEYNLTRIGKTLRPMLKSMCNWGLIH